MSFGRPDLFDAIAFSVLGAPRRPIIIGIDLARPGPDMTGVGIWPRPRQSVRDARRPSGRFHPTKGYRGAHKLFRGGSR